MNTLRRVWTGRRIPLNQETPRVLVVDDNEVAADALVMFFQMENLLARAAYGGVEAVGYGHTWKPHLSVMDISMPQLAMTLRARSVTTPEQTASRSSLSRHWTNLTLERTWRITNSTRIARKGSRQTICSVCYCR